MSELATVEIHSPKDASQRWIINEGDYDPEKHRLWGEEYLEGSRDLMPGEAERITASVVDVISDVQPAKRQMKPSVPDYIEDDEGNIVAVNIIDPEQRQYRKEIPYKEYDLDAHELWSTHPRFNR